MDNEDDYQPAGMECEPMMEAEPPADMEAGEATMEASCGMTESDRL